MGFDALSPWHLLIIAVIFVVLFGAKKLPDSARSLGRAMRIFKAETTGLRHDEEGKAQPAQQLPNPAPAAAAPPLPADDGTTVNGVPLSEAQRTNQPT
jgi:sec-independent protein translocase protein TatA